MHKTYSIIIPCYNAERTLPFTLESIINQTNFTPHEIILVDNNSSDRSVEIARSFGLKIIMNSVQGAGPTRNAGAKIATGTHLVFMDADVMLPVNWLSQLAECFHDHSWIEGIAGSLIPLGLKKNLLTKFRRYLLKEKSQGQMNLLGATVPVLNSALFSIKRSTFQNLGGFDESYVRMEDSHLGFKAFNASLNFMVHPEQAGVFYYPDSYISYFLRSFHVGFWFPKIHERPDLKKLFGIEIKEEPALQGMLFLNNLIFMAGYLWGTLDSREKARFQVLPSRNPLYGQIKYSNEVFVLSSMVSLIVLPEMVRVFHGGNVIHECRGDEMSLLLRVMNREDLNLSKSDELLISIWLNKQLFVKSN